MIVLMTAMGNNANINHSRNLFLLLIFFLSFSCNSKDKIEGTDKKNVGQITETSEKYNDSIKIIINNIDNKTYVALNIVNQDLFSESVTFLNETDDPIKSVVKKVRKNGGAMVFSYRAFSVIKNIRKSYSYMFLVDNEVDEIEFNFEKGDLKLLTKSNLITNVEEIRKNFSEVLLRGKSSSQKISLIKERYEQNLHDKKVTNNNLNKLYNDLEYYYFISMVEPKNQGVLSFLEKIDKPIYSIALKNLLTNFIKSNTKGIPGKYNDVNKSKTVFVDLLIREVANYVETLSEKERNSQIDLINWLKKTKYGDEALIEIKEKEQNQSILENIKTFENFLIYDDNFKRTELLNILNSKKSEYILIDFWATWCAPCIHNIKSIHDMDLPKDLGIVYISMDKTKDKDKWIAKSKELNLNNTYLFVENDNNKEIIQKIKLNQLPRYILLDKKLNVLNFNMITPQEGDFLKELKKYIK